MNTLKRLYRCAKWLIYNILTGNQASENTEYIPTEDITYAFKGDFSPYSTYSFYKDGNWDSECELLENHIVYRTLIDRFVLRKPWEETPHYQKELERFKNGTCRHSSVKEIDKMFTEWDDLYTSIRELGYKSNHELYYQGYIKNILYLLDEVTVNIARDGKVLLNSGYHRAIIAKILGIEKIPVRVLVRHSSLQKQ